MELQLTPRPDEVTALMIAADQYQRRSEALLDHGAIRRPRLIGNSVPDARQPPQNAVGMKNASRHPPLSKKTRM